MSATERRSAALVGALPLVACDDGVNTTVIGNIAPMGGDELIAAVEADTCLALIQVREDDDSAYPRCIGRLDRPSGVIVASCDSAALDPNTDGAIDTVCALEARIDLAVTIVP